MGLWKWLFGAAKPQTPAMPQTDETEDDLDNDLEGDDFDDDDVEFEEEFEDDELDDDDDTVGVIVDDETGDVIYDDVDDIIVNGKTAKIAIVEPRVVADDKTGGDMLDAVRPGEWYKIQHQQGSVEVWSSFLVPFEPRSDWQRKLKAELASTVRLSLGREPRSSFFACHAILGCAGKKPGDVENSLFYNIGIWKNLSWDSPILRFERVQSIPVTCPNSTPELPRYYMAYLHRPESGGYKYTHAGQPILTAGFDAHQSPFYLQSSRGVWALTSLALADKAGNTPSVLKHGYAMKAVIHAGTAFECQFAVKPIIDGIITALHQYKGPNLEIVSSRLAQELAMRPETAKQLLAHPHSRVLGYRENIRPWGGTLKVDPDDERCDAAEIRVVPAKVATELRVEFELSETL